MGAPTNVDADQVRAFLSSLFEEDLHAKRVLSMANATLGVIQSASLAIHAIGAGLATAESLNAKHAIKQVDRLLSNRGIEVWKLFEAWVPFVVGARTEIVVALDWTYFEKDDHATLALHLLTSHGRATPLLWMTVKKSTLGGLQNEYEDKLIMRLRELVPAEVKVTLLADRAFGDAELYAMLGRLGVGYVIRFRDVVRVTDENGEIRPAKDWVPANGRIKLLRHARVTREEKPAPVVACVKAKNMKEAWCLAASDLSATGAELVSLYSRRFTIEEGFRDTKDLRFGLGLAATRISDVDRRDRLLLITALATALLTLLGAAGESLGMDRMLKANTAKKRTHSLFRQGREYYGYIPRMKPEKLLPLVEKFAQLVAEQRVFRETFGVI